MFRPALDSSVWLGLTNREQLMSLECSKHQLLSLAKMLVVNEQKIFCSHQCSPETTKVFRETAKLFNEYCDIKKWAVVTFMHHFLFFIRFEEIVRLEKLLF